MRRKKIHCSPSRYKRMRKREGRGGSRKDEKGKREEKEEERLLL